MSEVSKPHSELGSKVREGLQLYLDDVCPEGDWFDAYFAALDSLVEQLEVLRETLDWFAYNPTIQAKHQQVARDALAAASNPASSPVTNDRSGDSF